MKIVPLINEITNDFNETFKNNLSRLNLESKIRDIDDLFILKLYESFLNFFDEQFKNNYWNTLDDLKLEIFSNVNQKKKMLRI